MAERDRADMIREIRSIRNELNTNFAMVNAQADAVLFESGTFRKDELAMRKRVLKWQPSLRTLLLLQLTILRYRIEAPSGELDPAVVNARRRFDTCLSATLGAVAAYLERGEQRDQSASLQQAYEELDEAIHRHYGTVPAHPQAILAISQTIVRMVNSLAGEIFRFRLPFYVMSPHAPENKSPTMQTR